jgi:hypothetical protein
MVYVPAGSVQARSLFPTVDHEATMGELTVIGDDGALWRGAKAWLTCLWALVSYRGLALTLARSGNHDAAKEAFESLSRNRHRLGGIVRIMRGGAA